MALDRSFGPLDEIDWIFEEAGGLEGEGPQPGRKRRLVRATLSDSEFRSPMERVNGN